MLLCVECDLYVEAAHDVLRVLPSVGVEENAPEDCGDISWAVSSTESVDSGVPSDRVVRVVRWCGDVEVCGCV